MDHLISPEDAANILNISTSTLAKMRLAGTSPRFVKLGRRVAYRQTDIETWIEAQSYNSTSEYSGKANA
ncbi:AlpA family transcriptional regulator [Agrobacterium vitis]|nr:AlpA family transcriptional regulator [Agrobacterium vitis]